MRLSAPCIILLLLVGTLPSSVSAAPAKPTPTSPGSGANPGPVIASLTPTLQWSGSPTATNYHAAISQFPFTSCCVWEQGYIYDGTSVTVPSGYLQPGNSYRWNVEAYDNSGVSSGWSDRLYFQTASQASAPVLSSASCSGCVADGAQHTLTLTGNNFVAGNTLTTTDPHGQVYQSQASRLSVDSSSQITYQIIPPSGTAGTWSVVVNSPDGTQHSASRMFTVNPSPPPAPVLSSASCPDCVADGQQHTLTLTGSNFVNGARLMTTSPAASRNSDPSRLTWVSSSRISYQLIPPSGEEGAWSVYVVNPDGQQSNPATFPVNPPPQASAPGAFTLSNEAPYCDQNPPAGPAVVLNWAGSNGATSYRVLRDGAQIGSTLGSDARKFTNNANLVTGQTYSYQVQASNSGSTTNSNTVTVSIPGNTCASTASPPPAPTAYAPGSAYESSAPELGASETFSWSNIPGASYTLRISQRGGGDYGATSSNLILTRPGLTGTSLTLSKTDINSAGGASSQFRWGVTATNSAGQEGPQSSILYFRATPPTPPSPAPTVSWTTLPPSTITSGQTFTVAWVTTGSPDHVNIHWDPTNPTASNCCQGASPTSDSTLNPSSSPRTLTAPTVSSPSVVKYVVHIKRSSDSTEAWSSVISITVSPATTTPSRPAAPTPIGPGAASEGSAPVLSGTQTFSWNPVSPAPTNYTLRISKRGDGSYGVGHPANIILTRSGLTTTSTTLNLADLPSNVSQFRWGVTAINGAGEGNQSDTRYFRTGSDEPTLRSAPVLQAVSCSCAADGRPHTLTLSGSNFVTGDWLYMTAPTGTTFWSDAGRIVSVTDSQITYNIIPPTGTAGTWTLVVYSPDKFQHSTSASFNVGPPAVPPPNGGDTTNPSLFNSAFLTDEQLTNEAAMNTDQVQAFLTAKGSYFASTVLDVDGVSFNPSATITAAAAKHHINPEVLLATIQKEGEGGPITSSSRPTNMAFLMGCISSSTARDQIACAAERFRAYQRQQEDTGVTVAGWKVGVARTTTDGVAVIPATRAIAGQFTYTPYVGAQWGGNDPQWGGVYLFWHWWNAFGFASVPSPALPPPATAKHAPTISTDQALQRGLEANSIFSLKFTCRDEDGDASGYEVTSTRPADSSAFSRPIDPLDYIQKLWDTPSASRQFTRTEYAGPPGQFEVRIRCTDAAGAHSSELVWNIAVGPSQQSITSNFVQDPLDRDAGHLTITTTTTGPDGTVLHVDEHTSDVVFVRLARNPVHAEPYGRTVKYYAVIDYHTHLAAALGQCTYDQLLGKWIQNPLKELATEAGKEFIGQKLAKAGLTVLAKAGGAILGAAEFIVCAHDGYEIPLPADGTWMIVGAPMSVRARYDDTGITNPKDAEYVRNFMGTWRGSIAKETRTVTVDVTAWTNIVLELVPAGTGLQPVSFADTRDRLAQAYQSGTTMMATEPGMTATNEVFSKDGQAVDRVRSTVTCNSSVGAIIQIVPDAGTVRPTGPQDLVVMVDGAPAKYVENALAFGDRAQEGGATYHVLANSLVSSQKAAGFNILVKLQHCSTHTIDLVFQRTGNGEPAPAPAPIQPAAQSMPSHQATLTSLPERVPRPTRDVGAALWPSLLGALFVALAISLRRRNH